MVLFSAPYPAPRDLKVVYTDTAGTQYALFWDTPDELPEKPVSLA
jgi:hypothetical protein